MTKKTRTLLALLLITFNCLRAQKIFFVGGFTNNHFSAIQKKESVLKKFKFYQIANENSVAKRVKRLSMENLFFAETKDNTAELKKVISKLSQGQKSSNIVFVTNSRLNDQTIERLVGTAKIITLDEFTRNQLQYKNTLNMLLLVSSNFSLIATPESNSSVTENNLTIEIKGTTNYPITEVKYKLFKGDWETLDLHDEIDEFNDDFNITIENIKNSSNKNSLGYIIRIFNELNDSVTITKNSIKIVQPFLYFNSNNNQNEDTIGMIIPERLVSQNKDRELIFPIELMSNVKFNSTDDKIKVEFFNELKNPLPFCSTYLDVVNCGVDKIVPIFPGERSPLLWVINSADVYNGKIAEYSAIKEPNDHLCGKAWNGYVKFSLPNFNISTGMLFISLRGYNAASDTNFPLFECR